MHAVPDGKAAEGFGGGGVSWLGLDDGILEHPKFIRAVNMAGSEAVHLWLGLRAYCGRYLTDGFIPADMVDEVRGPKGKARRAALDALIAVGLVDAEDGGLRMHNYLDWSESRDSVLRKRESARERQAKSRGMSQRDSARSHENIRRESHDPILSSPVLSKSEPPVSPPVGDKPPRGDRQKPVRVQKWARFPADWVISEGCERLAQELGLSAQRELAKILDHEFKTPRSDPEATFRTWLRRSAEMRSERSGGPPTPPGYEAHNVHKQAAGAAVARQLFAKLETKS